MIMLNGKIAYKKRIQVFQLFFVRIYIEKRQIYEKMLV